MANQVLPEPGGEAILQGAKDNTILVVDDEPGVLELVQIMLSREGYRILLADSASKALEVYAQHPGTIDLVLTDVMMPEMDGFTLARSMRALDHRLRVLYMTGGTPAGWCEGELNSRSNLLRKPFDSHTLACAVLNVLGSNGRKVESEARPAK